MLAVDPVKRITIPEITQHPFYTTDLQRHLTFLPPQSLDDLEIHPLCVRHQRRDRAKNGLGWDRIEKDVVDELASRLEGVDKEDIWDVYGGRRCSRERRQGGVYTAARQGQGRMRR